MDKSANWIGIGDVTVGVGQMKCLAILGVNLDKMEGRENLTLSHGDVEVLELGLTKSATGEHAFQTFEKASERVGGFKGIVIDQGSDVTKGCKQYSTEHPETVVIHDIKHKMALCLKATLEKDPKWEVFQKCKSTTYTRVQQTELKTLTPPKQRLKGRYMDISDEVIEWPELLKRYRCEGNREIISEERYYQYFDWVEEFMPDLEKWAFMVNTAKMITSVTREHGLSVEVYNHLLDFFVEAPVDIEEEELCAFIVKALSSLFDEVEKISLGETSFCSTEVLESVFGKHKEINKVTQGVTANVLGISTFVGNSTSMNEIKEALEACSVKETCKWIREKVGDTVASMRKRLFSKKKTPEQAIHSKSAKTIASNLGNNDGASSSLESLKQSSSTAKVLDIYSEIKRTEFDKNLKAQFIA